MLQVLSRVSMSTASAPNWRLKAFSKPKALSFHIQVSKPRSRTANVASSSPIVGPKTLPVVWQEKEMRAAAAMQIAAAYVLMFIGLVRSVR